MENFSMARYGISAVHYDGARIGHLWMGLLDGTGPTRWAAQPAPARLSEVIDRILAGDSVAAVVEEGSGRLVAGPPAQIAIVAEDDDETLAFPPMPGPTLDDLPRC